MKTKFVFAKSAVVKPAPVPCAPVFPIEPNPACVVLPPPPPALTECRHPLYGYVIPCGVLVTPAPEFGPRPEPFHACLWDVMPVFLSFLVAFLCP